MQLGNPLGWLPYLSIFASWVIVGGMLIVSPLDLLPAYNARGEMRLYGFYATMYWTAFVLMWVVLPLQQSYFESGHFTFKRKCWAAVRENLLFYGIALVLFVGILIYVIATSKGDMADIPDIAIALSNLWGLLLGILLLGYGLVELPKKFWHLGDRPSTLRRLYAKLQVISQEKGEARDQLNDALKLFYTLKTKLDNDRAGRARFEEYIEIIAQAIPADELTDEMQRKIERHSMTTREELQEKWKGMSTDRLQVGEFATLHYYIKSAVLGWQQVASHWKRCADKCIYWEDLVELEKKGGAGNGEHGRLRACWNGRVQPILNKVLAVVFTCFSIVLLWAEMMLVQPEDFSPFSLAVKGAVDGENCELVDDSEIEHQCWACEAGTYKKNGESIIIWGLVGYSYMVACGMFTLWRIKLGSYYKMAAGATNENSFLFNGALCLRLMFPLSANFFNIFYNGYCGSYTVFAGSTASVGFIGALNRFLPIAMIVFCIATWFNVYQKILKLLRISKYVDPTNIKKDAPEVREGAIMAKRYRRNPESSVNLALDASMSRSGWSPKNQKDGSSPTGGDTRSLVRNDALSNPKREGQGWSSASSTTSTVSQKKDWDRINLGGGS